MEQSDPRARGGNFQVHAQHIGRRYQISNAQFTVDMPSTLDLDLKKLESLAFDRIDWGATTIRRYHAITPKLHAATIRALRGLYLWIFVPPTLWPFNIQDVLDDCLLALESRKKLNSNHRLLIDLLPSPPNDAVCAAAAEHERHVQTGNYEDLLKTQAKYAQHELAIRNDPELKRQWTAIKDSFDHRKYADYKGVIRRRMLVERNLRPSIPVNLREPGDVFQAAFDAFCLRWNLYGMQHDEPLLLKLTVNLTAYGTMIHIPSYWSFDPKRDIRWDAIAKLHRVRVPGRQGAALAEGLAERIQKAEKLRHLDQEVRRLRLKGHQKHKFLCQGLGWIVETSPKRISRLRAEFKKTIR